MKKRKVAEHFIVPPIDEMDDEVFVKHFNARHRETDTPDFRVDIPYGRMQHYGFIRSFHEKCHQTSAEGGLINGERVVYNHTHEEDDDEL